MKTTDCIIYDGVDTPKYGVEYLAKILQLLDDYCPQQVLIFANFGLKNWLNFQKIYHPEEVVDSLEKHYLWPDHVKLLTDVRVDRISHTGVGSFVLLKQSHNKSIYSKNAELTVKNLVRQIRQQNENTACLQN